LPLYLNPWTQSTISAAVICSVEGARGETDKL